MLNVAVRSFGNTLRFPGEKGADVRNIRRVLQGPEGCERKSELKCMKTRETWGIDKRDVRGT